MMIVVPTTCLIVLAAVYIPVTVVFSGHILNPPEAKNSAAALVSLRSNSTVILADPKPPITLLSLTMTETTDYPGDYDHEIIIYQMDSDCSDFEIEETHKLAGTDLSLINGTTTYALVGSSMTYNICGSTNLTHQSERLELVLLDRLEALQSPSESYIKFYFFPYGTDGEWICKNVTYNFQKHGYYTPIFLIVPQEATFTYSMTYQRRFLKDSSISPLFTYNLSHNKDTFTVNGLSNGQPCFIATILENPIDTSPYVHVNISYTFTYPASVNEPARIYYIVYFLVITPLLLLACTCSIFCILICCCT